MEKTTSRSFGILFVRTKECRTANKQVRIGCVGDMCELLTEYTVDKVGSGTCGPGVFRCLDSRPRSWGFRRNGVGPTSSCVCLGCPCYFGSSHWVGKPSHSGFLKVFHSHNHLGTRGARRRPRFNQLRRACLKGRNAEGWIVVESVDEAVT